MRWLMREPDGLMARGFCHGCVPSGPVSDVACVYCGDGLLLGGALASVDPATDPVRVAVVAAENQRI